VATMVAEVIPDAIKEPGAFMATESIPYKLYNYDDLLLYNIASVLSDH
jgi:hypothetical protein